jgi:hypothetical protein
MSEFTFSTGTFVYPAKPTNGRIVQIYDLLEEQQDEGAKPLFLDADRLSRAMRLILDGPHEGVDWMQEDGIETRRAFNGFFDYLNGRTAESEST